jgi:histidyl-tRNA synthetase
MFRHDRPQAGRYRQFHQFSCESFGVHDPVVDAELIAVGYNFFRDLGINVEVQMNSIGNLEDRQRYLIELTGFLRSRRGQLSEESKKRLLKNPLRVLDSKEPEDQAVLEDAPQILDWLSDESKSFFMKTLEYLDEMGIPYVLNSRLVRGLDYYTDTVFEFYIPESSEASQSALGGGGRYNLLVEQLGGVPTPACGFSLGVERVMIELERQEKKEMIERSNAQRLPVFFAQLGEQSRRRTLFLIEEIRRDGTIVHFNLAKTSLKAQMEIANKIGATHTVIIGQKEVQDGTAIIRDMESGIQEIVDQKKLSHELKKLNRNDIIRG